MLLTKEVEVQVVGGTLKYYKSLGYDAKLNNKLKVKVTDLKKCSKEMIKVQCDTCEEIFDFHFDAYRRYREDFINTEYQCRECEIKEIWNEIKKECDLLDFTLISDISNYKTHKSKIKLICNIHKNYGIQEISVNGLLCKHYGCKLCSNEKKGRAKLLEFELVKSKFDEVGYILLETKYISAKTPMRYICPKHPDVIQTITYDKLSIGQGCEYCANERNGDRCRLDFDIVKDLFKYKNLSLISIKDDYKNRLSPLQFICDKHEDYGIQITTYHYLSRQDNVCKCCQYENLIGEKGHNYRGGISNLSNYLRDKIRPWVFDSLKYYNFKCVITNIENHNLVVHHLYSFTEILKETLNILDLPLYPQISFYSNEELKLLEDKFLELHYQKGFGQPLIKPLHKLFHYKKGYLIIDNGELNDFKQRYYNFEFDDSLEEEYKYKTILLKEVG